MARFRFALWTLFARLQAEHNRCPYCKSTLHLRLQRKKWLIEARKCHYCGLIFRWPVDSQSKAERFYEHDYRSGDVATDLPSPKELSEFRRNGFGGSRYARSGYIQLVSDISPPPGYVLDFGASWGYVGFQLQQVGYTVEGFELSHSRAAFGQRHLGLPIRSSWDDLMDESVPRFDVIFAAHTLEHVYDLWETLEDFASVIVQEGSLIIVVPNAGGRKARQLGVRWGPFIGETHTIAYTPRWFRENLARHGFEVKALFSSTPGGRDFQCDGDELVCVARYSGNYQGR